MFTGGLSLRATQNGNDGVWAFFGFTKQKSHTGPSGRFEIDITMFLMPPF